MASDTAVPVSMLLLKAKMVAVKLGLREMVALFDREIAGYNNSTNLTQADYPEYRWTHGTLKFENPYRGLCPITFKHGKTERALTRAFVVNSIREIEDSIGDEESLFIIQLSDGQRNHLNKNTDLMDMPVYNVISKTHLIGIITVVRASILNWALDLEQRGIMGQGLTFTQQEKQSAMTTGTTIHIGQIGTMQGIVGPVAGSTVTQNLTQSVTAYDRDSLRKVLRDAGVPENAVQDLDAAIDAEPEPQEGKIGVRVGSWIGNMAQKVATGVWKTATDKAIETVIAAINIYYGIGTASGGGPVDKIK